MKRNGKTKVRRPIEREYLAVLNATVSLDTWQSICKRAADDAIAGDAKARDWLSKWLLGLESRLLTQLAAEELKTSADAAVDCEIASCSQKIGLQKKEADHNLELLQSLYR